MNDGRFTKAEGGMVERESMRPPLGFSRSLCAKVNMEGGGCEGKAQCVAP